MSAQLYSNVNFLFC